MANDRIWLIKNIFRAYPHVRYSDSIRAETIAFGIVERRRDGEMIPPRAGMHLRPDRPNGGV